jgi:kinesin family protein 5
LWIKEDCTINGITLRTANSAQELEKAFDLGISNRQVSYTDANDNSSRSHLLFAFQTSCIRDEINSFSGQCIFVDLAGTETNQQTGFDLISKN